MDSDRDNVLQTTCLKTRELSVEEHSKLLTDNTCLSEFKKKKLESEAQKNWDLFYKRNTTKFFKDRHWTKREFEELFANSTCSGQTLVLFEVGCGVGNFMFPLLEENPDLHIYACDFSHRAVDFVKTHSSYDASRFTVFQADITKDNLSSQVPVESVDIATMIFVLSAIHPDKMVQSIASIAETLKPGGQILIRDYGLYDHAMLRFSKGHKLSECFYVRQDGTRAYYFSIEHLTSIMSQAGLQAISTTYIHRSTVNKKEGIDVPRIFIQGKFIKPLEPCVSNILQSPDS
ncbi:Methyltransferase-like protein 6 [Bulinus truncatus]|nr:Methyltransferase-like protein 6 [Bulinus truncatus]